MDAYLYILGVFSFFFNLYAKRAGVISVDFGKRDMHFSYDSGVELRKRLGFSEYGALDAYKAPCWNIEKLVLLVRKGE
jgi:hypothetical protein